MLREVTDIEGKYDTHGRVIFIENEIICIDQTSNISVTTLLDDYDVLELLKHIAFMAKDTATWKLRRLRNRYEELVRDYDERIKEACSGVFEDRVEAENDLEVIKSDIENIVENMKDVENAMEPIERLVKYAEYIIRVIPDVKELYDRNELWV